MAVLFLAAIGQPHAERSAEQRGLHVVNAQRVAAEQRVHEAAADQRRQALHAAGVHHHRTRHHDHFQLLLERLPDQRRGLPHGGLHLALRRDAVGHEGERQPVALLRFGRHADAAHAHHHAVARPDIAQPAAPGAAIGDHDQRIHALVLHFDPLLVDGARRCGDWWWSRNPPARSSRARRRAARHRPNPPPSSPAPAGLRADAPSARRRALPPSGAGRRARCWCGRCETVPPRSGRDAPPPYRRCSPSRGSRSGGLRASTTSCRCIKDLL